MDWIGIQCIGVRCITVDTITRPGGDPGKGQASQPGLSTTMLAKQSDHQEAIPMPNCVACGVELEPPVRVSHTIYAKTLYRIAGQEYCRHHIIRAAVAAGVITEVRAGVGPVVARPQE